MAPAREHRRHRLLDCDLVVDDQDEKLPVDSSDALPGRRYDCSSAFGQGDGQAENGPLVDARLHADRNIQHPRQTLHDGKSQSEPTRPIAFRISDLVEFLEDQILLIGRDAATGVPYLDVESIGGPPAADHNAPLARVAHGVREQIAYDTLEQDRISLDRHAAGKQIQREALSL